jgi:hypothetical protein
MALYGSLLLTWARLHLQKYGSPGGGDMDTFPRSRVAGPNLAVRTVFRTLVPNDHDRFHLNATDERSIQSDDYSVLMTALPQGGDPRRGEPHRTHGCRGDFMPRGDGQLLLGALTAYRRPPSSCVSERSQHG